MNYNPEDAINKTVLFVQNFFQKEGTGHDWWHTQRVRDLALKIARNEEGDLFVIEMAALLHDVGDYKFFDGNEKAGEKYLSGFLESLELPAHKIKEITAVAVNISFMKTLARDKEYKKKDEDKTPEFKAVSDADRLDAIGAIGIARAFTYGGYFHRQIYDPSIPPNPDISKEEYKTTESPSINHFYEKLLKIKDMMYTNYGKKLAEGRHYFLENYLERFYAEWRGDK